MGAILNFLKPTPIKMKTSNVIPRPTYLSSIIGCVKTYTSNAPRAMK
jgi:hypothetical protein